MQQSGQRQLLAELAKRRLGRNSLRTPPCSKTSQDIAKACPCRRRVTTDQLMHRSRGRCHHGVGPLE